MLIKNLKVSGLLSFGPQGIDLPMHPLNVLIGANGSGKSNLLEVINLFREAPSPRHSISGPVMEDGGISEWLWKGDWKLDDAPPPAIIECVVSGQKKPDLRHFMSFYEQGYRLAMEDERIELAKPDYKTGLWWFYRRLNSEKILSAAFHDFEMEEDDAEGSGIRYMPHDTLAPGASILAQVRDPGRYKVFQYLEEQYSRIQLYRDWCFGPKSGVRSPSRVDGRTDALSRTGENLALMVANMPITVEGRIVHELQTLYSEIQAIKARPVAGGSLQIFLTEKGGFEIPASRLSDGTLRYLALLIILLDAKPPPLIVIEEPELGLHPDVIPRLARLLQETSERTQLVVTTHSRLLVDCLGDDPESIVVCEKRDGESCFERLEGKRMKVWLEKFSLGDLWSKGELGGNRW